MNSGISEFKSFNPLVIFLTAGHFPWRGVLAR